MKLLALTGKAGAGKDSVADVLCEKYGFVRYEFARPLKGMLAAIGVDCSNRATKELPHPVFGVSPRRMAQTLGTEWGRDLINPDIWLLCADRFITDIHDIKARLSSPGRVCDDDWWAKLNAEGVVITDCRFQNEAAFIAQRGGAIWHVQRHGIQAVEAHSSEAGLDVYPGDVVIRNDGTLADLAQRVAEATIGKHVVGWEDVDSQGGE